MTETQTVGVAYTKMIGIKQRQGKWQLVIKDETWEFKTKTEMMSILNYLADMKTTYGQLKQYND